MLCAQRKGKCNIFRGKTNLTVGTPADMPHGGGLVLSFPSAEGRPFRRYSGAPLEAALRPRRAWSLAAFGGTGKPPPGGRGKRGQGHHMVPLPPLDSPKPSFALTHRRCAAKRGLRGLGSVRRAAYGWLLCPEFPLRSSPRMTVRGQTVQGGSIPLRKAPLRSRVCPWSTRRPCGPPFFRRATEGRRVQGKMRGSQEGDKKPFGVLFPFCSRR